jgi:hypothetical protein
VAERAFAAKENGLRANQGECILRCDDSHLLLHELKCGGRIGMGRLLCGAAVKLKRVAASAGAVEVDIRHASGVRCVAAI